mmetsp:Transcript_11832/g.37560  ORF Transcript_11832/g.37560 Transcript_11832/m.37560 type:complete len:236 (+) Transcript_11832:2-709(+)
MSCRARRSAASDAPDPAFVVTLSTSMDRRSATRARRSARRETAAVCATWAADAPRAKADRVRCNSIEARRSAAPKTRAYPPPSVARETAFARQERRASATAMRSAWTSAVPMERSNDVSSSHVATDDAAVSTPCTTTSKTLDSHSSSWCSRARTASTASSRSPARSPSVDDATFVSAMPKTVLTAQRVRAAVTARSSLRLPSGDAASSAATCSSACTAARHQATSSAVWLMGTAR